MTDSMQANAETEGTPGTEPPPPSAPENISVSLRGFDTEEHARAIGNLVATYIRTLSRYIDMSALDGITIAFDYPQALHTLAHECAHVEVTERFNAAFPAVLLQSKSPNLHEHCRWEVIKACWDEYAVTQICAPFGQRPTNGYEETFITALERARPQANALIKAYRVHGNLEQIVSEVYSAYGDLMKFACYHLGNMAGLGLTLDDVPKTKDSLAGHWFAPFFDKLKQACGDIAAHYGEWSDRGAFEALGDLTDEIVAGGGLTISNHRDDGTFHVDIPFTLETMPGAY